MENNNKLLVFIFFLTIFQTVFTQLKKDNYEPINPLCSTKYINDSLILNCTKCAMTKVLTQWPPHSTVLTASFNYNNITDLGQFPPSDANISLSFSHCGIKTVASALFIDAIGIKYFDLSWNELTGKELQPSTFRGPYTNNAYEIIYLQQLDLSHNKIESLHRLVFEHTPYITHLNLNSNPLTVLDPQTTLAISSLLHLQVLHLAHTSLKTIPVNAFARLRNVKQLDLTGNLFTRVPDALVALSSSLEKLKIGGNPMQHLEDRDFMGYYKLRELNISSMPELQTIYHNTFAYLPNLQVLHCTHNEKLFHIHQQAFGTGPHIPLLSELYISHNNLETIYLQQLHWTNLSILDLSGNRWLCDCELYHTLITIYNHNPTIVTSSPICTMPVSFTGTALEDVAALEKACNTTYVTPDRPSVLYNLFMKTVLVLSLVMFTLLACFVFWRVLVKFNSIRAINTMFPVMYVSAPTFED